jgi:pullulanase/glycogen debranching enzyme
VKDLAWFRGDGRELADDDWRDAAQATLAMYLDGQGIRMRGPRGERVADDSLLLVLHTGDEDAEVVLPGAPWARAYDVLLDTADERPAAGASLPVGTPLRCWRARRRCSAAGEQRPCRPAGHSRVTTARPGCATRLPHPAHLRRRYGP